MKRIIFLSLIMTSFSSAFAAKIGCGLNVTDDFKLNRKVVEGGHYKMKRASFGKSQVEFTVVPLNHAPAYKVTYQIKKYQVSAFIENLSNGEIAKKDLGSIHPKKSVYGQIFSEEFSHEITPIEFEDESGKTHVLKSISGKCKLKRIYLPDLLPIP